MSKVIHLQGPGSWTRLGLWIPELPDGEISWDPGPDDRFPGITSCLDCIAGRRSTRPWTPPREGIRMWTIYDHPSDYPSHYVVREWVAARTGYSPCPHVQLARTLDEARRLVPEGLMLMPRDPSTPWRAAAAFGTPVLETWA